MRFVIEDLTNRQTHYANKQDVALDMVRFLSSANGALVLRVTDNKAGTWMDYDFRTPRKTPYNAILGPKRAKRSPTTLREG